MAGSGKAHLRPDRAPVLSVEDLVVEFPTQRGTVHAVSNISLDVLAGETLGIVGESGCGKSSMGRAIVQMPRPTSGVVDFEGTDLTKVGRKQLRQLRPRVQMIYQDPIASLNPRRTIHKIVSEPLVIWKPDGKKRDDARIGVALENMGFDPKLFEKRRPKSLSGGQCQRVCIARALVLNPTLLICDEPVSALDVSVQAQILNLMKDMRESYGLSMVFISHDLGVVNNICDRIAVMYLGKLCEVARPDDLYQSPRHPYTSALLDAIPERHVRGAGPKVGVHRDLPSPLDPPSGCRFRTRCPRAQERCAVEEPQVRAVGDQKDHWVACHFPLVDGETIADEPAPDAVAATI
jgi:peptide/nickel transport system ATP-binding protein